VPQQSLTRTYVRINEQAGEKDRLGLRCTVEHR
jgi:hypothetical protein